MCDWARRHKGVKLSILLIIFIFPIAIAYHGTDYKITRVCHVRLSLCVMDFPPECCGLNFSTWVYMLCTIDWSSQSTDCAALSIIIRSLAYQSVNRAARSTEAPPVANGNRRTVRSSDKRLYRPTLLPQVHDLVVFCYNEIIMTDRL